jgi:divalent metal cation (Fe/Co/Zn/Cd) transporter
VAKVTGNARWDAAGSLGIGILLVIVAVILAVEMKSLLIGESARAEDVDAIKHAVESTPNIRKVIHLRTLHIGPEELFVGIKVDMDRGLSFAEVATTIDDAEVAMRAAVPAARTIYIEPDCER